MYKFLDSHGTFLTKHNKPNTLPYEAPSLGLFSVLVLDPRGLSGGVTVAASCLQHVAFKPPLVGCGVSHSSSVHHPQVKQKASGVGAWWRRRAEPWVAASSAVSFSGVDPSEGGCTVYST